MTTFFTHIPSGSQIARSLLSAAFLLSLTLGTTPLPPPYHQYVVSGSINRPFENGKAGFAVVILGYSLSYSPPDSTFQVVRSVAYPKTPQNPVGLTDSSGAFVVVASSEYALDSLRLGVIVPDRPMTMGPPFAVDASEGVPRTEPYYSDIESGCSSCSTDPEVKTRTAYFSYHFSEMDLIVSF